MLSHPSVNGEYGPQQANGLASAILIYIPVSTPALESVNPY